jgi:hypothetical protein
MKTSSVAKRARAAVTWRAASAIAAAHRLKRRAARSEDTRRQTRTRAASSLRPAFEMKVDTLSTTRELARRHVLRVAARNEDEAASARTTKQVGRVTAEAYA